MNCSLRKIAFLSFILIYWGTLTLNAQEKENTFNVRQYGAIGDGKTLDTKAIQKAIDAAAKVGRGARVLVPGGHQYLIGTLVLKSGIEFHLQGDAQLIVSTNQKDYTDKAAIVAYEADSLKISGTGSINGRALEFMSHYEEENEWWIPKGWRPRLFILTKCTNLEVWNITIEKAPSWSLHMLGCENVLIDGIKIKNDLDVPNSDGIDPDHCRNVEIRNFDITCGDDAIVIKTTGPEKHGGLEEDFGPSANIWVHDGVIETQDSGVKIGTETTQDIFNIVFERLEIKTSVRGLGIQLRDEGDVYNVVFKDIIFNSRYQSDPWWGRGEAISFTAIPRIPGKEIGKLYNILVKNVKGIAENSVRINGTKESRIINVRFDDVDITMNRWTKYVGGLFDNRPTKAYPDIETAENPGISIRFSDNVTINNSSVSWGENLPDYFTNAIKAHDVSNLKIINFKGNAAHPEKYKSIDVPEDNVHIENHKK